MTEISDLGAFLAYFENVVKNGWRKRKKYVVKQNPDDSEETQFDSFYAKDLRGFCFGFKSNSERADAFNFTRRTLFKKLLERYEIPFFIEEKKK